MQSHHKINHIALRTYMKISLDMEHNIGFQRNTRRIHEPYFETLYLSWLRKVLRSPVSWLKRSCRHSGLALSALQCTCFQYRSILALHVSHRFKRKSNRRSFGRTCIYRHSGTQALIRSAHWSFLSSPENSR